MPFALALMRAQVRALYTLTPQGRLLEIADVAEEGRIPAPRLFLGRTPQGHVWHVRHDLPAHTVEQLEALCRREPPLTVSVGDAPSSEPRLTAAARALLGAGTGEFRGPAYWLPPDSPVVGGAIPILPAQHEQLALHFPALQARVKAGAAGPVTAVLGGDGQAVCVCSCVRLSGQAAEAGVRTVESERGKGHAPAAVTLWAELVRRSGRLALYSTSWDNRASQAVARKSGAMPYGEDFSLR